MLVNEDSLKDFRTDHPDPTKVCFIMMKFGTGKFYSEIEEAIKSTLKFHGITGVRADDKPYDEDLLGNVVTYMRGCGFGIAVFERIESDIFNPNVALEVGYMFAMGKQVCLLKEKSVSSLHADILGKLYVPFDLQDIPKTIEISLSKWLKDHEKKIISSALPIPVSQKIGDKTREKFNEVKKKIQPELLNEIRSDLVNDPSQREFMITSRPGVRVWAEFRGQKMFFYAQSNFLNLNSQLAVLEHYGFIKCLYRGSDKRPPKYLFQEEFVDAVLAEL